MRFEALMFSLAVMSAACSKKTESADLKATPPVAKETDKPANKPAEPPPAEAKKGGCSYITEAEATAALGQPSKYRSNDGSDNCIIDPVAEETATTMSVDFTVHIGDTGSFDHLAKSGKPLEGIGDKAVIDGAAGMAQIAVVKGTATLSMMMTGPKAADPAIIKAFTEKVFSHL